MTRSRENELAEIVVDASFRIHRTLGPGLLESAYEAILMHELQKRGLNVAAQVPVPVVYESVRLDTGFRADLIVEDSVLVELKSLEKIAPVHKKQLTTYLKLSGKRLGLLINFGEELIKNGITRIVNGMPD
ncbi:GxxExxY protein [Pelotalea chapellei]|uniref:GxxExxY protein n=1 Tax=Pelotalea chapellei TaxID=44671 RepID=A0ABS5UC84_9BACT|nr:GxxExxY protein [Pelotalea chapellei]MBT1073253.1 GxxExxY protein [Pelotalea chapellei]